VSGPKGVGGKVRVKTQMGWGMGQCPDPKGVGGLDPWSDPKGSGVGDWGLGRVWTQEGWVRPCPNPRGVEICVCALTQGDWVCVRTQGGWALGPSMSGPNRFGVWGLGPFVSGPRGFGSFCIRTQGGWCLGPSVARPKRFGLGRLTQQKGVHVRTQCASQQTRWPG
jgi:hypothetical protein